MISNNVHYAFDDVLLVPGYSDIASRKEVSLAQEFLGYYLNIPILSAAMDTVTGPAMAAAMHRNGGLGVLHRFQANKKERLQDIEDLGAPQVFSIGINEDWTVVFKEIGSTKSPIVNIDVAHGDHEGVVKTIKDVKKMHPGIKVIAGNVATRSGYYRLAEAGADAIKVGIGGSSVCTTRIVTGHGMPLLSSIMDCYRARLELPHTRMIADGGIDNSGHIVKALAAGADAVMLGTLLSGTDETPGRLVNIDGQVYKQYRGMSTVGSNQSTYTPEGVSGFTPAKGPVDDVLQGLVGGIKSGLSYSGARNLQEFRENAEFILVSNAAVAESKARLTNNALAEMYPIR